MKKVTEAKLGLVLMRILCSDFGETNRKVFCERISSVSSIFPEFAKDLGRLAMEFVLQLNGTLEHRNRFARELDDVLCSMVNDGFIGNEAGWDPRNDF